MTSTCFLHSVDGNLMAGSMPTDANFRMWQDVDAICSPPPSVLFAQAMAFAGEVHLYRPRKVVPSSYLSHLMLTTGFVSKNLGTMRACVIGGLHDVFEEGGNEARVQLQRRFPGDIYRAVMQMSSPIHETSLGWTQRKERSIARMANLSDADVAMAFAGDKAATLFELVQDVRQSAPQPVLNRMGRSADQLLWYYGAAHAALAGKVTEQMADFLAQLVKDLKTALRA